MADVNVIRDQIRAAAQGNRNSVIAQTYHQKWPSASRPVLCSCNDGKQYVIKGSHNGRALIIGNMIGRFGQLLDAPVGQVVYAEIPQVLRDAEPQLSDVGVGIGHGTLWMPDH